MDLPELLAKISKLNDDVQATMSAAEALGETIHSIINSIQKQITTKAVAKSIHIHEEE